MRKQRKEREENYGRAMENIGQSTDAGAYHVLTKKIRSYGKKTGQSPEKLMKAFKEHRKRNK